MGVAITSILPKKEITFQELQGKKLAIDSSNIIYQLGDNTHSPCLLEDIPVFECYSSDSSSDFSSEVD